LVATGRTPFKVGLCSIAFRERLLEYTLDLAADIGFHGVEIWGREPHISEEFDASRVAAVRRMVAERGLEVPVFGSYLRPGATNANNSGDVSLKDVLQIAAALGAPIIRVWASDVGSEEAEEGVWAETVRELREASASAAKMGMILAAEMHGNTLADTGESARRLVEEVDSEAFALNFQASSKAEEEKPMERLARVLPKVVHLHAQNYAPLAGRGNRVERVALEDGIIDYRSLVSRLREAGYQGYLAVEFCPSNVKDKAYAIAQDYEFLRSL
jgi:3-dehydroshikimate dehydratase